MPDSSTIPAATNANVNGYIGVRKTELTRAIIDNLGEDAPKAALMSDLFRMLGAVLHFEAASQIEALKDLYHPIDPETPARRAATPDDQSQFETAIHEVLRRGNFEEIDPHDIEARKAARLLTGLQIKTSDHGIRTIRFFARGARASTIVHRSALGLRKKLLKADVLRDVIVLVSFKTESEINRKDARAFASTPGGMRPGAILIKQFRNVARADLLSLHPGAKPAMRPRDQVFLAAPAIAGGIPMLMQIGPAITVLFAVLATWFGMHGAIENSDLKRALTAASLLIALGAFVMRQWVKYERQTLKYQKQLSDIVYFRTMANNSAVLDCVIGEAEEQDAKEAMLAYWVLQSAQHPMTKAAIDQAAETFLRQRFGLDIDFEIGDALEKLQRLSIISSESGAFRAESPADALARLDQAWDAYFDYAPTSRI